MSRARDLSNDQANVGGSVAPFVAGKNKLINADFLINQRNTTSTTNSNSVFLADRWKTIGFSGTATWSISTIAYGSFANQVTNKGYRITSSSASNDLGFQQTIEGVQTLAGQTVTISFWARTSGTSYALDLIELLQNFGTGGSSGVYTYFTTSGTTITSTWTKFSLTTSLPSIAGKTVGTGDGLNLRIDPATVIANGDWIEFTQIQLEAGSVATPFTTATGTIQGELAACQRYYWRTGGNQNYEPIGFGVGYSTTQASIIVKYPVRMRAVPTTIDFASLALQRDPSQGIYAVTSIVNINGVGGGVDTMNLGVTASNQTAGTVSNLIINGTTSGYFGLGAEL